MFPMAKRRLEIGMSRAALAKAVGATEEAVGYWERKKRTPSAEYYPLLAKALKIDKDTVIGWFHKEVVAAK